MTTLRKMVNPLKQSGNNDSLLNRNLQDAGYILRRRKVMQRVLFEWHSFKLSYLRYDQNSFMLGNGLVCILV